MTDTSQARSDDLGPTAPQDPVTSGSLACAAPGVGEAVNTGSTAPRAGDQTQLDGIRPSAPQGAATPGSDGGSLLTTLIGQAAAAITVTAALIYGAGALTLAFRLGFTHLSWESVLGQLPYVLVLTAGFGQVILPATIIGLLGVTLLNYLTNQEHHKGRRRTGHIQLRLRHYLRAEPSRGHFLAWLAIALVIGMTEAGLSQPIYYYYKYHYYRHPALMIPEWEAFLAVAVLSTIAVGLALIGLPPPLECLDLEGTSDNLKPLSKLHFWQWKAIVGVLVAIAVIPGVAAFSASTLFPYAQECWYGPGYGYLSGNLIGTNNGWAYMVEYSRNDFSHDWISVVPLSSVRLLSVGKWSGCYTQSNNP